MVKVEGLSREEIERRSKESKLKDFVMTNLTEGFVSSEGSWVYARVQQQVKPRKRLFGWHHFFIPSFKDVQAFYVYGNSCGPKIEVQSSEYLPVAEQLAEKFEKAGLTNFYNVPEGTQMIVKKSYQE